MINGISDQHVLSYNPKKKSDFEIGVLKVTLSKVWIDSGRSRFFVNDKRILAVPAFHCFGKDWSVCPGRDIS